MRQEGRCDRHVSMEMGGWMDGWMDGWMNGGEGQIELYALKNTYRNYKPVTHSGFSFPL